MPELPEVETVKRGITPYLQGNTIQNIHIYQTKLRWPIPSNLENYLIGQPIQTISRRGKYLLLQFPAGHLLIHLGMSGVLRIVDPDTKLTKHDHIDFQLNTNLILRYNDVRRFGTILWTDKPVQEHQLIKHLGPEPLSQYFNENAFYALSRNRNTPIKTFIMNSRNVVGVGNIYANEALFLAGIRPDKLTGTLTKAEMTKLVEAIKTVIKQAIEAGGTTLKDFRHADGKPGYFRNNLKVYGRGGQPCLNCHTLLVETKLGQRQTVFCPNCQTG